MTRPLSSLVHDNENNNNKSSLKQQQEQEEQHKDFKKIPSDNTSIRSPSNNTRFMSKVPFVFVCAIVFQTIYIGSMMGKYRKHFFINDLTDVLLAPSHLSEMNNQTDGSNSTTIITTNNERISKIEEMMAMNTTGVISSLSSSLWNTRHNDVQQQQQQQRHPQKEMQSLSWYTDDSTENMYTKKLRYQTTINIPQWMKEYFDWHREQTRKLNATNWEYRNKYIILICYRHGHCGGLADRLKPLPVFIAAAAKSKRILFIRWERPAPLEEFLLPNEINWTVPSYIVQSMQENKITVQHLQGGKKLLRYYKVSKAPILTGGIQEYHGAPENFQMIVDCPDNVTNPFVAGHEAQRPFFLAGMKAYHQMYHDLFRIFFTPSEPIDDMIQFRMNTANLTPGQYIGSHNRIFYALENKKETVDENRLRRTGINAVNCASSLLPGYPIYFASDSDVSIDAVHEYAKKHNHTIVAFKGKEEPLHIDLTKDWETRNASDFYLAFVDLLMMGSGAGVSHGKGGFGVYAALLSSNSSNTNNHFNVHCEWHN